jgi:hypothetical protein
VEFILTHKYRVRLKSLPVTNALSYSSRTSKSFTALTTNVWFEEKKSFVCVQKLAVERERERDRGEREKYIGTWHEEIVIIAL